MKKSKTIRRKKQDGAVAEGRIDGVEEAESAYTVVTPERLG